MCNCSHCRTEARLFRLEVRPSVETIEELYEIQEPREGEARWVVGTESMYVYTYGWGWTMFTTAGGEYGYPTARAA